MTIAMITDGAVWRGERNGQNGHSSLQMIHILWPNIETVSKLSNQIHCRLIFIALRLN